MPAQHIMNHSIIGVPVEVRDVAEVDNLMYLVGGHLHGITRGVRRLLNDITMHTQNFSISLTAPKLLAVILRCR